MAVPLMSVVALATSLFVVATPAGAAPSPINGTNSQISSLKERAQALAEQITTDQNEVSAAAEQYDEETVLVQQDQASLAKTQRQIAVTRHALVAIRKRAEAAAVAAYVSGDGDYAGAGAVLSSSVDNAVSASVYSGVVANLLNTAMNQLHTVTYTLTAERASKASTLAATQRARQSANQAGNAAQRATVEVTAALQQVKGKLYTLTVEREQEIAAAEAAAAEAAAAKAATQKAAAEKAAAAKNPGSSSKTTSTTTSPSPSSTGDSQWPFGTGTGTDQEGYGDPLVPDGTNAAGETAVAAAESYLGVPYVWGGASRKGVDCSGLTMLSWEAAGVYLLHGATIQDEESTRISLSKIEPGDLLFYHFADDGSLPITHVAIYIGSGPYGAQTIIQAEETGTDVAYFPMYWSGFVSAGRP